MWGQGRGSFLLDLSLHFSAICSTRVAVVVAARIDGHGSVSAVAAAAGIGIVGVVAAAEMVLDYSL